MGDNSMYWQDQSTWYQPQHPHAQATHTQAPVPPQPYQAASYPPPPGHELNHQASTPTPPQPQSHHPMHQQRVAPMPQAQMHHQPMIPNGVSNGNQNMQSTIAHSQRPQSGPMNQHYNPHMNNHHHESAPMAAGPMQPHQPPPPTQQQQQVPHPPPQHQNHIHNHMDPGYQTHPGPTYHQQQQQPPHSAPMYPQPNHPYQNNMMPSQQGPPISHQQPHSMQQQPQPAPHQPQHYPQQQYSPPSYWNSSSSSSSSIMHNQGSYGPPSASQGSTQSIPTPPSNMSAENPAPVYHHTNNNAPPPHMAGPAPGLPYENRGQNTAANYNNASYHQHAQPASGYYNPHDVNQNSMDPSMAPYEQQIPSHPSPHQPNQPHGPPASWSNGYYQPSQSPYPSAANSYPVNYNGGNSNPVGPTGQAHIPAPHQLQAPHQQPIAQPHGQRYNHLAYPPYPSHHQAQQSQQWPIQNQMDKIERTIPGEKKPVKPRAPKKQSDPNAPKGRRKRGPKDPEQKKSGYSTFYALKKKEIQSVEFGDASKIISDSWARLSEEEKSTYIKNVSNKRKEILRKKASQQAQNLLDQGIKQESDITDEGRMS